MGGCALAIEQACSNGIRQLFICLLGDELMKDAFDEKDSAKFIFGLLLIVIV